MGTLHILSEGLKLGGSAFAMDQLITSHIKSRKYNPIFLKGAMNYTISVRDRKGYIENFILLGNALFVFVA